MTTLCQSHLDAGGVVRLDPGVHTVIAAGEATGDALTTPYGYIMRETTPPLILEGAGAGHTIIRLAAGQPANCIPLLIRGSGSAKRAAPTVIRHLTLDGNAAAQTAPWSDFGLLTAIYADNVTFEDCEVIGAPYFLTQTFRNSQGARWLNCRFVSSATNHQVRFEAPGVLVQGCDFTGAMGAAAGALLALATNADIGVNTREARVIGNRFRGGFQAINAGGAQRCLVLGNTIEDQINSNSQSIKVEHYAGAVAFDATDNLITNNILYNVRNGVILGSNSTHGAKRNTVESNLIIDGPDVNLAYGVWEQGASVNDNIIRHNRVTGATIAPVSIVGSRTRAYENT